MRMRLILNGEQRELGCEPTEMLLDVLEREGLTAARATCRIGVCGSCTVLLDGDPVTGCILFAAQAEGREVTTAEALDGADPVQRAFLQARAFQCGWCTPGFVLTVRALLQDNPDPSDEEIAAALGGNLCRCGSYVKIADAVRIAARDRRERA